MIVLNRKSSSWPAGKICHHRIVCNGWYIWYVISSIAVSPTLPSDFAMVSSPSDLNVPSTWWFPVLPIGQKLTEMSGLCLRRWDISYSGKHQNHEWENYVCCPLKVIFCNLHGYGILIACFASMLCAMQRPDKIWFEMSWRLQRCATLGLVLPRCAPGLEVSLRPSWVGFIIININF